MLAILGLPTFGLALAITTVSTYLPLIAHEFTRSATIVGLVIGGEGIMALALPLLTGSWSDRLHTTVGGRLPFVLVGVPVAVTAVALVGFVGSMLTTVVFVALFFAAYYIAYEPYRALYPDLLDDEISGRGQSTQALWRGAGTGIALAAGGWLFGVAQWLPFVGAGALLAAATATFMVRALPRARAREAELRRKPSSDGDDDAAWIGWRAARDWAMRLLREHPALRVFLVANALWELSLSALKTFVVLFVTVGLGHSVGTASAAIGAVAALILVTAPFSGRLGDRFGTAQVMLVASVVYGAGLLIPAFSHSSVVIAVAAPAIAVGGGTIMTLPYALLMPMMPRHEHGAVTGLYSVSRGVGTMLGPLLAGAAIELLHGPFAATQGYAAMWLVSAGAILAGIPLLARLRHADEGA